MDFRGSFNIKKNIVQWYDLIWYVICQDKNKYESIAGQSDLLEEVVALFCEGRFGVLLVIEELGLGWGLKDAVFGVLHQFFATYQHSRILHAFFIRLGLILINRLGLFLLVHHLSQPRKGKDVGRGSLSDRSKLQAWLFWRLEGWKFFGHEAFHLSVVERFLTPNGRLLAVFLP